SCRPATPGQRVGVLREALIRLAGQGLVRAEPQLGFTVTPLSRAALIDLTEARVVLESTVFGYAIEHGDTRWEADVVAAHHLLARTPVRDGDDPETISPQWSEAHLAFHRALLAGCPNRRLRELADSLRVAAELYRHWSLTIGAEPERDVAAEHAELLTAVLERDLAGGADRLAAHIRRTAENLLDLAEEGGGERGGRAGPGGAAGRTEPGRLGRRRPPPLGGLGSG
ncbi:GntR family transcriptional regulator, partial [Plantactinospora sp. CA-290183]|uniref:GntR family transcriptional regulator n=1 Tax=Plantactinospora sp. CA-290183 TaxID=3240006 RepID=UPI003D8C786C